MDQFLSINKAAHLIDVSPWTIRKWIKENFRAHHRVSSCFVKVHENPYKEDTKNLRVRKAIFQINKNIIKPKSEGFTKQMLPNHPLLKGKIRVK